MLRHCSLLRWRKSSPSPPTRYSPSCRPARSQRDSSGNRRRFRTTIGFSDFKQRVRSVALRAIPPYRLTTSHRRRCSRQAFRMPNSYTQHANYPENPPHRRSLRQDAKRHVARNVSCHGNCVDPGRVGVLGRRQVRVAQTRASTSPQFAVRDDTQNRAEQGSRSAPVGTVDADGYRRGRVPVLDHLAEAAQRQLIAQLRR